MSQIDLFKKLFVFNRIMLKKNFIELHKKYKYLLYNHMQMHACMQNPNDDTIKTSDTVLLEKYTFHFIWKGCTWEGVGDWIELQHIDPHSIGHNHISFPFSWAAQPGAWGPASLGAGFLYRILSPTGLVSKLLNRGPEGSLCCVLAFSTASCLQLIEFPVH